MALDKDDLVYTKSIGSGSNRKLMILPLKLKVKKLKDNFLEGSANAEPFYNSEIIAALASAQGRGGVAVIRVSGKGSLETCLKFLKGRKNPKARMSYLYKFIDPSNNEVIDEPLVLYFEGPNSFTGEDSVEIHCHGGPYIVQNILRVLFSNGIRIAEPGEFTKRAFLNGKMDLTEASVLKNLLTLILSKSS